MDGVLSGVISDAISGSGLIASVFGKEAQTIGNIVQKFDFSKISSSESTSDDFLHCDLAPSFGKLNNTTIQEIDDQLKIMIAGTMQKLAALEDKSWDKVLATMQQNVLVEPDGEHIARADKLMKESSSDFKFDGSSDATIVREVQTWFTSLIGDDDVIKGTKIDIEVLGKIVAQTGAAIDSFEAFFLKEEYHEQTMVDIGVLRFPDIEHPHFKLYRIKLTAWSKSNRVMFHQEDKNGITGEYNCRKFKPRESVIKDMSEKAVKNAVAAADAMFA